MEQITMKRVKQNITLGAMLPEEARILTALTEMVLPDVIVEFGYHTGFSGSHFLKGIHPEAHLYSYDVDRNEPIIEHPQFTFLQKRMEDFTPEDVDNQEIDMVLFDAAHSIDANNATLAKVEPHLSKNAYIIVHDTGYWLSEFFACAMPGFPYKERGVIDEETGKHYYCAEERLWVAELQTKGWSALTLHTDKRVRHGLTILQKESQVVPV